MVLGEKIRAARTDAGLTQKQLSDGIVTRNMLSQIENGAAKPSMKTLEALAARLNKSISFFLEESWVGSPNVRVMEDARKCFDAGDYTRCLAWLESYQSPDGIYDREKLLLEQLCLLELAKTAMNAGKLPYVRRLLDRCGEESVYCRDYLRRERLLIQGRLPESQISGSLPSLDEELMIRAGEALRQGLASRAAALLDACEDCSGSLWQLLRGKCCMAEENYIQAKRFLQAAETAWPKEVIPMLEICFRELGDYQQAYQYACRQRR